MHKICLHTNTHVSIGAKYVRLARDNIVYDSSKIQNQITAFNI